MDLLRKKVTSTRQALATLQEVLALPATQMVQDSCIQRFEYTLDLFWKTLKEELLTVEGKAISFPKDAMRAWGIAVPLPPEEIEIFIKMVDDRNLSTHLYDEEEALRIYKNIGNYSKLIEREVQRLESMFASDNNNLL